MRCVSDARAVALLVPPVLRRPLWNLYSVWAYAGLHHRLRRDDAALDGDGGGDDGALVSS